MEVGRWDKPRLFSGMTHPSANSSLRLPRQRRRAPTRRRFGSSWCSGYSVEGFGGDKALRLKGLSATARVGAGAVFVTVIVLNPKIE
jgi:hypothetical protein